MTNEEMYKCIMKVMLEMDEAHIDHLHPEIYRKMDSIFWEILHRINEEKKQ